MFEDSCGDEWLGQTIECCVESGDGAYRCVGVCVGVYVGVCVSVWRMCKRVCGRNMDVTVALLQS